MKKESNSQMALNAMHRAAKKAVERAASLDLSIPVWKDDKIILVKAKDKLQKLRTV
ncbi:MAG: hypothetical protein MI862_12140 [Desulfobacterales bacterium]|nr:hypothetical protein [Desulfobacterales bacterium]